MKIAYFVNQYPKVSHTFVRREILALEAIGVRIGRYSLRSSAGESIDAMDAREAELTKYILDLPVHRMLIIFAMQCARKPFAMIQALVLALRTGWRSDRGILRHFAYLLEAAVLESWSSQEGVEHIHAHFGTNSATVAMLASRIGGLTFSFTAHGADEVDTANRGDMRLKLDRATFVVAVCAFVRSQLMRRMPSTSWPKVKVVHCGLDREFLAGQILKIPAEPRLVCVGRLCDEKAQLLLVEAAGVLRKNGIEFSLVLVGDGPLRSEIEALIAKEDLQGSVTITGWLSNAQVREELNSARALVLPSLMEGLPVAIMEAMALGRPVISTYISGIPELVIHGETGWLVPAGEVGALANAMEHALSCSIAEIETLGRKASLRVRERHDAGTEALKLRALFDTVTSDAVKKPLEAGN